MWLCGIWRFPRSGANSFLSSCLGDDHCCSLNDHFPSCCPAGVVLHPISYFYGQSEPYLVPRCFLNAPPYVPTLSRKDTQIYPVRHGNAADPAWMTTQPGFPTWERSRSANRSRISFFSANLVSLLFFTLHVVRVLKIPVLRAYL